MQTLWSRVALTKGSCRCPQCLSSANVVSRRAAASATRRMPRYLTSSTLWYSGIFAAAATFDAGIKKDRREQWDKAIAGVKQELGEPSTTTNDATVVAHEVEDHVNEDTDRFQPFDGLLEDADGFRYVDSRRQRPRWPSNTGPALMPYHLAPESIYAAGEVKEKHGKRRWSIKKLATVQTSIEVLQLKMFQHIWDNHWTQKAAAAVPDEYAKHILEDMETLEFQICAKTRKLNRIKTTDATLFDEHPLDFGSLENDVSLCNYNQDDASQGHRTVQQLNLSLQELFNRRSDQSITRPALIAKLAYNLSISSIPPNLDTYNTLLVGLSRMNETSLVGNVIASMSTSHLRMNEVSLSTILNHHTKNNQSKKFVRLLEKIRGKHGGLALARPDIHVSEASNGRLFHKPDQPDNIIQCPYPTPMVFGAVISGVIKFAGFDAALSICQGMGQDGWGLCMAGLTPLLHDCAQRGDWSSGLVVWKQIQDLKIRSRIQQGARAVSERIRLDTFAAMLRLCSRCKQQETFGVIWDQARISHPDSTEKLVKLVKGRGVVAGDVRLSLDHEPTSDINYRYDVLNSNVTTSSNDHSPEDLSRLDPSTKPPKSAPNMAIHADGQPSNEIYEQQETKHHQPAEVHNSTSLPGTGNAESSLPPQHLPPQSRVAYPDKRPPDQSNCVLEEQLSGNFPASSEIDDYELGERPMSMHG